MDWFVRAFIRSSVTWLAAGVTVGLAMVIWPRFTVYRVAHMHMLLMGFVAMMIFGFGYHVAPRLAGNRLFRRSWAGVHVWLANLGLAALVAGLALRVHAVAPAALVLTFGGVIFAIGAYAFAINVLLSTRVVRQQAPVVTGRTLPTVS